MYQYAISGLLSYIDILQYDHIIYLIRPKWHRSRTDLHDHLRSLSCQYHLKIFDDNISCALKLLSIWSLCTIYCKPVAHSHHKIWEKFTRLVVYNKFFNLAIIFCKYLLWSVTYRLILLRWVDFNPDNIQFVRQICWA